MSKIAKTFSNELVETTVVDGNMEYKVLTDMTNIMSIYRSGLIKKFVKSELENLHIFAREYSESSDGTVSFDKALQETFVDNSIEDNLYEEFTHVVYDEMPEAEKELIIDAVSICVSVDIFNKTAEK